MTRHALLTLLTLLLALTGCSTQPPAGDDPSPPPQPSPAVPRPAEHPPSLDQEPHSDNEGHGDEPSSGDVDHHPPATQHDVLQAAAAAKAFVRGWLTPDPELRRHRLEPVTSRALLDAFDSPWYRPLGAHPIGPVHILEQGAFRVTTAHRLDTGQVIEVELHLEPDAPHGWLATAIRER